MSDGHAPIHEPLKVFAGRHEEGQDDGPLGTIALPTRDHLSAETVTSLLMSDFRWQNRRPVTRVIVQGSQLPLQRNECVHTMQGDWLLFIDDDMTFGKTAIGDIVATYHQLKEEVEEPIVLGGLCVRRTPPHQPTLYVRQEDGSFNFLEDWEGDIIEVDATGTAFMLIEVPVFEAIMDGPWPTIEERNRLPPWPFFEWRGKMGEDLRFCDTAQTAGARIFIDTRIRIGHLSERAVDITDFWREVASRSDAVTKYRKEWNDGMDMPTLSREKALERLQG
jgi:hypothetical protein